MKMEDPGMMNRQQMIDFAFANSQEGAVYLSWLNLTSSQAEHIFAKDEPKSIFLNNNCIGSEGLRHFSLSRWHNLLQLHIGGNSIGNKGAKIVTQAKIKLIEVIYLDRNCIGEQGALHLSKGNWQNLKALTLFENRIGQRGASHLLKGDWKSMRALDLWCAGIGVAGVVKLLKSDWKSLFVVKLKQNDLSDKQIQQKRTLILSHFAKLKMLRMSQNE